MSDDDEQFTFTTTNVTQTRLVVATLGVARANYLDEMSRRTAPNVVTENNNNDVYISGNEIPLDTFGDTEVSNTSNVSNVSTESIIEINAVVERLKRECGDNVPAMQAIITELFQGRDITYISRKIQEVRDIYREYTATRNLNATRIDSFFNRIPDMMTHFRQMAQLCGELRNGNETGAMDHLLLGAQVVQNHINDIIYVLSLRTMNHEFYLAVIHQKLSDMLFYG